MVGVVVFVQLDSSESNNNGPSAPTPSGCVYCPEGQSTWLAEQVSALLNAGRRKNSTESKRNMRLE